MAALIQNLPILAELLILLVAIGFAIQQIRSVNRLQRERAAKTKENDAAEAETRPDDRAG
jgi:hypothetical protein